MSTENLSFLKALNKKVVRWSPLQEQPPAGKSALTSTEFTNVCLSKQEFKRILEIITEELLVMLPQTHLEKGLVGYVVHDVDGRVVLEFCEKNIPEGFSMEKLFSQICNSPQNKELLQQLADEGIMAAKLPKTFQECCSC